MWTVEKLLREAGPYLKRKGVDSARLEAELLLACALSVDRVDLFLRFDKPLRSEEVDAFRALVMRRINGEPTAYIRGVREFFSLDFEVTPAVLIPRPETEEFVQAALDAARGRSQPAADGAFLCADIGTGSGCVAVTLAVLEENLSLLATDLSADALIVAERNARRHGVAERITFLAGHMVEPLSAFLAESGLPERRFDLITCNPPYIDPEGTLPVDDSVRRYEPQSALFTPAGDPLCYYREILEQAETILQPKGEILFEVAAGMAEEVADLGRSIGFGLTCRRKDLAGVWRVVGFTRPD